MIFSHKKKEIHGYKITTHCFKKTKKYKKIKLRDSVRGNACHWSAPNKGKMTQENISLGHFYL